MFRNLTREELTLFKRESNKWGLYPFFKNKLIVIKEENLSGNKENNKLLFLITENLKKFIFYPSIYASGMFLGSLNNKKFYLSLSFLFLVSKFGNNYPFVVVSDEAEKLVLYGRDILGGSIIEFSPDLKENLLVIIFNKNKEPLGIGRSRFSNSLIQQKGRITVSTLMDLGAYLREENNKYQYGLDTSLFLD